MVPRRPMLFYADWPLGYVNQEAERKARHFASRGFDVVYVAGVGTRNPRLRSLAKARDRLARWLSQRRAPHAGGEGVPGLRSASVVVAPPRQLRPLRALNARWMERQLRSAIADWPSAVAWIRSATPELVDALPALDPAVVVYEAVDVHHAGPGMVGVWRTVFEDAERALVDRADAVVVTNEPLADRFRAWGADVRFVPHGVDLFPWRPRSGDGPPVLGFLGVLDGRLDVALIRSVARARPAWRIRLVGPVEPGFDPASVRDLPNVTVEQAVPHARIGEVLAEFDVGLLAYADLPAYRGGFPLKSLELLAAGRPVVVRPTPALGRIAAHVRLARTPAEFVEQTERALAEDSHEAARARRAVAEANGWGERLERLDALLGELLARRGG